MKKYDLETITVTHSNPSNSGVVFVSFASWSISGNGQAFGESFFKKHGYEVFHITQKGRNHWWHTVDMVTAIELINERTHSAGKRVVAYGSSMGGYGAFHYAPLLSASTSICISPQLFIDYLHNPDESRWRNDLEILQGNFLFSEIGNVQKIENECFIFYDPFHQQDKLHITRLAELGEKAPQNIRLIELPFGNHDCARLLANSGFAQDLLHAVANNNHQNLLNQVDFSHLFRKDRKSFLNHFRSICTSPGHTDELREFHNYMQKRAAMDFEEEYMAAEIYAKIGKNDLAVELMKSSINSYTSQLKKPPPNYLLLKLKNILR